MLLLCVLPWEQTTLRAEIQIREVFLSIFFFPESIIKISKQKKKQPTQTNPKPRRK